MLAHRDEMAIQLVGRQRAAGEDRLTQEPDADRAEAMLRLLLR